MGIRHARAFREAEKTKAVRGQHPTCRNCHPVVTLASMFQPLLYHDGQWQTKGPRMVPCQSYSGLEFG